EDVEQQQIEALLPQEVERLAAVLGEDDGVSFLLEASREQEAVDPIVVGDEDRAGGLGRSGHAGDSVRRAESASSSGRYSCWMRSTGPEAPPSSPSRARCSSGRHRSAKPPAPSVAPFDFSVCAARRSSSAFREASELRRVASRFGASERNASIT